MMNESIPTPESPVAATAFGAEVTETPKRVKKTFALDDPGFTREAPRTNITLKMVFKCVLSGKGKPYFRCPDTENGTVMVCPKDTPDGLIGKCGYLTIGCLPGTVFEESDRVAGAVMPSKPVTFVSFRD